MQNRLCSKNATAERLERLSISPLSTDFNREWWLANWMKKKNRIVCVRHISVSTKSQNHSNSLFMFPFAYFHSQERLSNNTESFNKEDLPKRKTVLMIKHSSQSTCCSSAAGSQTVWSRCLAAPETKQNTWVLPWPDLWGHTQTKFTLSRHN